MTLPIHMNQIFTEDRRQKERLTVGLKRLVRSYPEGVTILKELLQNADDAGARRLVLTIDWRDHRSKAAEKEGILREWLGPALLAWNDSRFTQEDFEAISRIGESSKVSDITKTGRFGVGFNSVYNITDFPCFVSCNRAVFFDPHERYIRGNNTYIFGRDENTSNSWAHLPTLRYAFEAGGFKLDEDGSFGATLFRFPFRINEHAEASEIKQEVFDREKMERLLQVFADDGEQLLLFLKNILSVEIREIEEDASFTGNVVTRDRLIIWTDNEDEVEKARESVKVVLNQARTAFAAQCQERPTTLPVACFKHQITTLYWSSQADEPQEKESIWRIVNGFRSDLQGAIPRSMSAMAASGNKAIPWAGAATRLYTSLDDQAPIAGRIFCFLPLPQSALTGLPIHIHGFFDLDDSRTTLTVLDTSLTGDAKVRGEWNRLLVQHVVAPLCVQLVESLKEDFGDDVERYYATWPVQKPNVKALEGLQQYVLQLLKDAEVVRIEGAKRWGKPRTARTLKSDFRSITEPLTLLGYNVVKDKLSSFDATILTQLDIKAITPENVRLQLGQPIVKNEAIGLPPERTGHPALQKREWIVDLLRFCLSDGSQSVLNLPLALRADGNLTVFDGKTISEGNTAVREIFATRPQWFLASDQQVLVPELHNVQQGFIRFGPGTVASNLSTLYMNLTSDQQWEPEGDSVPNAKWLTHVYLYLASLPDGTLAGESLTRLRSCPLVPGTNGKLYHSGSAVTPLQADRLSVELQQALKQFNVRLVGDAKNEELGKAISSYVKNHPDELIYQATAHDVVDTISAQLENWSNVPPSNSDFTLLLNFFADHFADIKDDKRRLASLRDLSLYPIQGTNERVKANEERIYLTAAGYLPPEFSSSVRFVQTGVNERWRPLLAGLGIPELTRVLFLRNFVLPQYITLSPEKKKAELRWIRENLDASQSDLRASGDHQTDLKQEVQKVPLVQCKDGAFRLISAVYNPDSESVKSILGDTAPVPDFSRTYSDDSRTWSDFFSSLRWRTEPRPQDIISRIDHLIDKAERDGMASAETDLRAIFEYVSSADRWNQAFATAQVVDGSTRRSFAEALSSRTWVPVQRTQQYLRNFPAARIPDDRLHRPSEVTFVQYGNQAASQFALFIVNNPPTADIQSALGFPAPGSAMMNSAVLSHFDRFLAWFTELPADEQTPKQAGTTLRSIYNYLDTYFVRNTDSYSSLQTRFSEVPCLWDGHQFWPPRKCFAAKAEIFGGRRGNVHGDRYNDVYVMLGQRPSPSLNDLILFLREMHGEYDGTELTEQDIEIVRKVSRSLARDVSETHRAFLQGLPLLTVNNNLVPSQKLLINDDPSRTEHVENQISRSGLSLLHRDIPSELAALAGCPSLFEDVEEQLTSKPRITSTPQSVEWTARMKNPEFFVSIRRLARHQGHEDKLPEAIEQRLKRLSFVSSEELVVDLCLIDTNVKIAQEVPTNYFIDPPNSIIYIRRADEETMRSFCAEALNRHVLEATLDDLSILEKLFNRKPGEYERFLNDRRVRPLVDESLEEINEADEQLTLARLDIPDEDNELGINFEAEDTDVSSGQPNLQEHPTEIGIENPDKIATNRETADIETLSKGDSPEQSEQDITDSSDEEAEINEVMGYSPTSSITDAHKDTKVGSTTFPSQRPNSSGTSSSWSSAYMHKSSSNNGSQGNIRHGKPQSENRNDAESIDSEHQDDVVRRTLDEPKSGAAETLHLPEAHTPYGGQVHARTPIRPIDDDLLRHHHPEAKIVSMTEDGNDRRSSRRSRSLPGYTGPQEPATTGQIMLLARSLRDGMLHLRSPKPAALFQSDEAQQDEIGLFFPIILLGEDTESEPIHLRVDYSKEVLHFDEGVQRERVLTFLADHELHPGCQLTVRLLENGVYRLGYENEPSTVTPVPLLGLDADGKPIVTWSQEGIEVPCPVDRQLFIGLRRVVDAEASQALWLMAEDGPDILEALQRLLRDRSVPVSEDDLYRLNYHIRPVSYAYFTSVLQSNTGNGKLFLQSSQGFFLNPKTVTEIITPRMSSSGRKQDQRKIDWERLRQALLIVLTELADAEFAVEEQADYVILVLQEVLA